MGVVEQCAQEGHLRLEQGVVVGTCVCAEVLADEVTHEVVVAKDLVERFEHSTRHFSDQPRLVHDHPTQHRFHPLSEATHCFVASVDQVVEEGEASPGGLLVEAFEGRVNKIKGVLHEQVEGLANHAVQGADAGASHFSVVRRDHLDQAGDESAQSVRGLCKGCHCEPAAPLLNEQLPHGGCREGDSLYQIEREHEDTAQHLLVAVDLAGLVWSGALKLVDVSAEDVQQSREQHTCVIADPVVAVVCAAQDLPENEVGEVLAERLDDELHSLDGDGAHVLVGVEQRVLEHGNDLLGVGSQVYLATLDVFEAGYEAVEVHEHGHARGPDSR